MDQEKSMLLKEKPMLEVALISLCFGLQDVEPTQPQALIRAGVWLPRLGGTIEDGGGEIDFETSIDLRTKKTTPMVEFSITPIEDVTMTMSFFDFSTSGTGRFVGNDVFGGMVMRDGDSWSATTKLQSVGIEASWNIWAPYTNDDSATLSFAPVVGIRWFGVGSTLGNRTTSQDVVHKNSWIAIQGGFQMEFKWDTRETFSWADAISIEAQMLVGSMFGGDGGVMASIQAGLTIEFTPSMGGVFGYRLQELRAEDGDYTFEAGLQGLFIGGEFRF
jgi:hypothetical protein